MNYIVILTPMVETLSFCIPSYDDINVLVAIIIHRFSKVWVNSCEYIPLLPIFTFWYSLNLGLEMVSEKYRPLVGLQLGAWSGLGYMYLSLLAMFIRNWRHLQLALGLSFFPFIIFSRLMVTSPRYVTWNIFFTLSTLNSCKAMPLNKFYTGHIWNV